MKLSVIIVNYNVKYFLEQCLNAVQRAAEKLGDTEVIVVDNNSVDGSVGMVRTKFPQVRTILNPENRGFSYANNQGIRVASGSYVLLLNPDSVVEEDTFLKAHQFMEEHPDGGALGVKMIDGKGKFLPESKRSLPTPAVAFYKIFGFSKFFPQSKEFGKYHLGFLDKEKVQEVEVLSGAFMFIRKSALEKTGLLDEAFFMYGEDIDISYRLMKEGFKNYYFPGITIIHYKGESTKKSSINYVLVFYKAMLIFSKKHFSGNRAFLFSFLIHIAIYLRAAVATFSRISTAILLPFIDGSLIYTGIVTITHYWEKNFMISEGGHTPIWPVPTYSGGPVGSEGGYYPQEFLIYVLPSYSLIWLFSIYLSGGYDRVKSLLRMVQGILAGTALILIVYALLPETMRYSRALILMGSGWTIITSSIIRIFLHAAVNKTLSISLETKKRIAIAGSKEESERVSSILARGGIQTSFIGFVSTAPSASRPPDLRYGTGPNGGELHTPPPFDRRTPYGGGTGGAEEEFIGNIGQLKEIASIYKIDEIIFCAKDITAQQIIRQMSELQGQSINYKIAPPESLFIIGSNSAANRGEFYTLEINSITLPANKRNKRILDIFISMLMIPLFPVLLFIIRKPLNYFTNFFKVLFGFRTWVGYSNPDPGSLLPGIKPGILTPAHRFQNSQLARNTTETISDEEKQQLDIVYAKDYQIATDLLIVWKGVRNLGG